MTTQIDLREHRFLVVGGTGEVGEGIVRRLLLAGAQVLVPARSEEKRIALLSRHAGNEGRLSAIVANFSTLTEAEALRDAVREKGPFDGVVASIGGWWQGNTLDEITSEEWSGVLASNLQPHFAVARAFIPELRRRPRSVYLPVLGGAADHPIPHSGLVSVSAAAVKMLARTIQAELGGHAPAIRMLQIDAMVETRSRPQGLPGAVTADDVGALAAELLSGTCAEPIVHLR